jgi:hypothetical protein
MGSLVSPLGGAGAANSVGASAVRDETAEPRDGNCTVRSGFFTGGSGSGCSTGVGSSGHSSGVTGEATL